MRLIDVAHRWAASTLQNYQQRLRVLQDFEKDFDVSILHHVQLERPAVSPAIPLTWAQLRYSLRPSTAPGNEDSAVSFNTVRQLRSAASHFATLNLLASHPEQAQMNPRTGQIVVAPQGRFTDGIGCHYFATGFASRVGTATRPAAPLLDRHVRGIDKDLETRYLSATTLSLRAELCKAALANLSLWLGWLRSMECFNLLWRDVHVTRPRDYALKEMPPFVGVVVLDLLPETKTERTRTADVVLAYRTMSGLSWGKWFQRLRYALQIGEDWENDSRYLFAFASGSHWTSRYYRETYVYPVLRRLQVQGDPAFSTFDDTPGNRLEDHYNTLHMYCRGARRHVGQKRPGCRRKATNDEVYEHARWKCRRGSEVIDKQYDEWTLPNRVNITLLAH